MVLPNLNIPTFLHIPYSLFVNLPIFLIILSVFFVLYTVITSVLMYHWLTYGMKSPGVLVAESLFLLISVVLFVIAGMALSLF